MLERFLDELSKEVSKEKGVNFQLPPERIPNIDRYLKFMNEACGFNIAFEKDLSRRLNLCREARNMWVHSLGLDVPERVRNEMESIFKDMTSNEVMSHELVLKTFSVIIEYSGIIIRRVTK